METLFWLAVFAAIGWALFKAGQRKGNSERIEVERRNALSRAFDEPTTEKAERALAAEAQTAAERISKQARAAEAAHHASLKTDRAKIEKARKLVKEAGVERALPSLWEKVHYWASWVKLPEDRWTAPDGVTEIAGSKEGETEQVSWTWRDNRFRLSHTKKHNYTPDDDYNPAELSLEYNGELVFTASCQRHYSDYGSSLSYSDIDALTVGEWMVEVVELEAALEAASRERMRQTFGDMEREKAARMNLGD